jgi:hypothetical protein
MQPLLAQQVPRFRHEVVSWARSVYVLEYIARIKPAGVFKKPVAELIEKRCRQVRPAELVSRHCTSNR